MGNGKWMMYLSEVWIFMQSFTLFPLKNTRTKNRGPPQPTATNHRRRRRMNHTTRQYSIHFMLSRSIIGFIISGSFPLASSLKRIPRTIAPSSSSLNRIQYRGGGENITTMCKSEHETTPPSNELTSSIWTWEDQDSFCDKNHIGYSEVSDPDTFLGGWLAHRYGVDDKSCWIKEAGSKITRFDYSTMPIGRPPRLLILYGSLRSASFSRKLAFEFARLLEEVGCDVRCFNPRGLPVRDPDLESHVKVQELRALTQWSDGHVWVSPEMHGQITGVFKNQIDWIPLNTGSIRPTQGKTCCVAQVNGGSQSFNAVNALRILARWMRMPCVTNQSSVPKAWQEFNDDDGRMKESSYRDRVVDVAEEFAKFTAIMAPISDALTDRFSERKEKEANGRLLSQAEKEKETTIQQSRKG